MSIRRLAAAAAILLALVYLLFCFPENARQMIESLQGILGQAQVLLYLPEGAAAWLLLK